MSIEGDSSLHQGALESDNDDIKVLLKGILFILCEMQGWEVDDVLEEVDEGT